MVSKPARKHRLDKRDWLDAALAELAGGGINAVAIEKLAARLGVTRGSFYHHFHNREQLLREMLDYWAEHWTVDIRSEIAALGLETLALTICSVNIVSGREFDL